MRFAINFYDVGFLTPMPNLQSCLFSGDKRAPDALRSRFLADRTLGFDWLVGRSAWCQPSDDKFLKEIGCSCFSNFDERIFERQCRSIAVLRWIVQVGNTACGDASEDAGVIRLPASVIALANHGIGNRVEKARSLTAASLV